MEFPFIPHHIEGGRSRLAFAQSAEERLKHLDLDVIHDMGMGWYCDVFQSHGGAWRASTDAKALSLPPLLCALKQATIPWLPRYRAFQRMAAHLFSDPRRIVLCVSQMVADDFLHYHALRSEQIRVVYYGVDSAAFSPVQRGRFRKEIRHRYGVRDDETLFLFVGNDFYRKGLTYTIRALEILLLKDHEVRLLVVGGKPYRRLNYFIRRSRLHDRVKFTGLVNDVAPYYAAADAFLLPTLYDPSSLSVMEAAASGLPCVTTRRNGASEFFRPGVDGYILDNPWDVERLAEYMQSLLDAGTRQRMGDAARRIMLQHTPDKNCDEIVAIYEQVARLQPAYA